MSLAVNTSQGPNINHLANTLVESLQNQFPGLAGGAIITARLVNQVKDIIIENLNVLGSAFLTAGFLTLLPSLLVTAVNVLGFTAGGVLKGSVAALIQSLFYGGQTGGFFSVLQAFGATAVISSPVVRGTGVTLAVVGAGVIGYKVWSQHQEKRRINQDGRQDSSSSSFSQVIKSPRQQNDFFRSRK